MSGVLERLDLLAKQQADLLSALNIEAQKQIAASDLQRASADLQRQLGADIESLASKLSEVPPAKPAIQNELRRASGPTAKRTRVGVKKKRLRRTKAEMEDHREKLATIEALGLKRGRGRPAKGDLTPRQIARIVASPNPEVALAVTKARARKRSKALRAPTEAEYVHPCFRDAP